MSERAHYYEAHEAQYVKRLGAGQVAWDGGAYDDFFMRPFVARSLERSHFHSPGARARALELGCGTGPLSCQLAEAGFDVTGIDISPSAIAFAREVAATRNLPITFEVGDVCRSPFPPRPFDLIVDGHLLHCVVFENERRGLLERVRQSLAPGGEFWLETMLLEEGQEPDPAWNLDNRGVVWAQINDGERYFEAERRDESWWLPQRLIGRSANALLAELRSAGLRIVEHETYPPTAPRTPGGLRARCAVDQG
jgi:SAM-dependent methyltransferase